MKRPLAIIIFVGLVIVTLSVVQASVANQISTTGADLVALQDKLDNYKRENMVLQEKLLQASSLTNLSEKAKKLGFVDAKKQVYLNTPLPLALKQ